MGFLLASLLVTWILLSELTRDLTTQEQNNRNGLQLPVKDRRKQNLNINHSE